MPCTNCGAQRTIKAHLIPQTFVKEIRGEDKAIAMTNGNLTHFEPTQNGRYDDAILCALCDNALGKHENYACQKLTALRQQSITIIDRTVMVDGLDGERMLHFAMGIVWKYTLTRPH